MAEINWNLARIPDFAGNAYAAQAEGQKVRDQSALKNAYATYAKDPEAGIAAIMPYDPAAATQLASGRRQEKRQDTADALAAKDRERADLQRKAELGTKIGLALKSLPPTARQGYIQQQAQFLTQSGLTPEDIASIPLDDASIEAGIAQAMSVSDYLKKANDDRTYAAGRDDQQFDRQYKTKAFEHTVAKDSASLGIDRARLGLEGQRVAIARQSAAQAGEGVDKTTRATEASLRKEFNALADVKNYRTVATQAAAVKHLANAPPSANGDIAMVYAVMKSYDPTSVVRETEFANAQNAAGVPDKIRNKFNALRNGQRLNPKQRAEMAKTVESFANTYKQRYDTVANEYRGYASDYSGNPDRVVTVPQEPAAPIVKPPPEFKARQGANGKFYAPDPNRPKSFPEVTLGADGAWRMKSANGQTLKYVP